MNAATLTEWRSGTGKVIRLGDTVRVDTAVNRPGVRGSYRYKVRQIRCWPGHHPEIDVFGGKPGREQFHTFIPEVLHVCRQAVAS